MKVLKYIEVSDNILYINDIKNNHIIGLEAVNGVKYQLMAPNVGNLSTKSLLLLRFRLITVGETFSQRLPHYYTLSDLFGNMKGAKCGRWVKSIVVFEDRKEFITWITK